MLMCLRMCVCALAAQCVAPTAAMRGGGAPHRQRGAVPAERPRLPLPLQPCSWCACVCLPVTQNWRVPIK
eukprot:1160074-Pelagomonas_calceolata.AAC.5